MKLERCKDQKSASLYAFYAKLLCSETDVERRIGQSMLSLISRLRALPDERQAWGLTSHYQLCLLAHNDGRTPRYVKILGIGDEFTIEYLMPERKAPWPRAYVTGTAQSEERAAEMILKGMDESQGWKEQAQHSPANKRRYHAEV